MRPIHLALIDKRRPALVLTRSTVRPYLRRVTIAPITSTVRGLRTEVPVGPANGLDHPSVISCDNITTIDATLLQHSIGWLLPEQEPLLTEAIMAAFDLD